MTPRPMRRKGKVLRMSDDRRRARVGFVQSRLRREPPYLTPQELGRLAKSKKLLGWTPATWRRLASWGRDNEVMGTQEREWVKRLARMMEENRRISSETKLAACRVQEHAVSGGFKG